MRASGILLIIALNTTLVFGQIDIVDTSKKLGVSKLKLLYDIDTISLKVNPEFFDEKSKYLLKSYDEIQVILSTPSGKVAVFDVNGDQKVMFTSSEIYEGNNEIRVVGGTSVNFFFKDGLISLLQHTPNEIEEFNTEGNMVRSSSIKTIDDSKFFFLNYGHGLFDISDSVYRISLENGFIFSGSTGKEKVNGMVSVVDNSGREIERLIDPNSFSKHFGSKVSKSYKVDFYKRHYYLSTNGDPRIFIFNESGEFLKELKGERSTVRNYDEKVLFKSWLFGLKAFDNRMRYFHRKIDNKNPMSSILDYFPLKNTSREIIIRKNVVFATNTSEDKITFLIVEKGNFVIIKMERKIFDK